MPPKSVYFSSIYSFADEAVDEVRSGSTKFVRYDRKMNHFVMKCDSDTETKAFTAKLRRYIANQPKENSEDAKLHPLPDTYLTTPLQLLKAEHYYRKSRKHSNDDSGDEVAVNSGASYRFFWQPACGTVPSTSDLYPLYAGLNCVIDTERQRHGLEIRGLDARVVFRRLENTEKLWEVLRDPFKSDMFALDHQRDNHRFELCSLRGDQQEPHPAIRRILLDDTWSATSLVTKAITQLRFATTAGAETPSNLQKQSKIHKERTRAESSQWEGVTHEGCGKGKGSQLASFTGSSSNPSSAADQHGRVEISREQSRYLTLDKSERVNEWAGSVEVGAEPSQEVEAPPRENATRRFGKSRRVKGTEEGPATTKLQDNPIEIVKSAPDEIQSEQPTLEDIEAPSDVHVHSDAIRSDTAPNLSAPPKTLPGKKFGKTRRVKAEGSMPPAPSPIPAPIDPYAGLAFWDQSHSSEKVQSNDEVSDRKFHSTMTQKAGKPKNKGTVSAWKKRKEVLDTVWGKPPESSHEVRPAFEATSRDELFALRYAVDFFPCLNAAQAFFGRLELKIDIGQILVTGQGLSGAFSSGAKATVHDLKDWDKVFYPANNRQALMTAFTNLLTTNGRDIDYILNLRYHQTVPSSDDPFAGKVALFDIEPKERATCYEFHCHSKDNQPFVLTFSANGNFLAMKSSVELGTLHMHYLAQIWDARMSLFGSQAFHPSDALIEAINELKDSIFIPGGRMEVEIQYVRPSSNEIMIDKVLCKRMTKHACKKNSSIIMVPTQVQRLHLQSKSGNSALCRAYSTPYTQMVDAGALHWTVSLESEHINRKLRENEKMVPGNLPKHWTPQGILFADSNKERPSEHLASLLDTTDLVMKQIDGVGALNFGSLLRVLEASGSAIGGTAYGLGGPSIRKEKSEWPVQPDDSASQVGGRRVVTHVPSGGKVEVDEGNFW